MEAKIGIQKGQNKPTFGEVPLGGLFLECDMICLKIGYGTYEDNYVCIATLDDYKSNYIGTFDTNEADAEIDEIITNAKIVW